MTPRVLSIAPLILALAAGVYATSSPPGEKALSDAHDAWHRGDYVTALNEYIRLLESPGGDSYLEAIALQTGEWFETREVTQDGRNPRFSRDGKYLADETGLEFVNHGLVTETSKTTAATLMLLASSPSRIKDLELERTSGGAVTVSWAASPEKGVTSYIVIYGPPSSPASRRVTVRTPRATLGAVAAGTIVGVKAVNARGLEGWDWARVTVDAQPARTDPAQ